MVFGHLGGLECADFPVEPSIEPCKCGLVMRFFLKNNVSGGFLGQTGLNNWFNDV